MGLQLSGKTFAYIECTFFHQMFQNSAMLFKLYIASSFLVVVYKQPWLHLGGNTLFVTV